jgi:integrase
MTERKLGCANRRQALAWLCRWVRLSRRHSLDATTKRSTIILTTADGKPWTAAGFRASWRKACAKAGIEGLTFNDLRGTAVTRLALAECTEPEIATITGHSLRDVRSILDAVSGA